MTANGDCARARAGPGDAREERAFVGRRANGVGCGGARGSCCSHAHDDVLFAVVVFVVVAIVVGMRVCDCESVYCVCC